MRMPFPMWNSAFDGLYPPGHQWYWRADFFSELTDEAIAAHLEHGAKLPTMQSSMHLYPINGAAGAGGQGRHRVGVPRREVRPGDRRRRPGPGKAGLLRDWCVAYHEALHPYSMGGAYVNMMMDDEGQERGARATASTTTGSPASRRPTTRGTSSGSTRTSRPAR